MAKFNIKKHEWEDHDIERVTTYGTKLPTVTLRFKRNTDALVIDEKDSIALAKHFGHYKEPADA